MSFYQEYKKYTDFDFNSYLEEVEEKDIKDILTKDKVGQKDFLALLAPAARNCLEEMAHKAHQLTVQHFGRVVSLYAPLYLANYCVNQCVYCGFKADNDISRQKLSPAQIEAEAAALAELGIKNLLILTGESRKHTPLSYLKEAIEILKEYFPSLAVEIYPLETAEYEELIAAGVDSLTIYQEVYDEEIYDKVHLAGPKQDYHFRLNAPERGCKAGMRSVNLGALLGLADWKKESFWAGLHAQYLQNKYLETKINLSLPRLNPRTSDFASKVEVSDKDLVQIMLAFRLFLPRVGLNLSTRESEELRNNLLPLGVTKMSAESSTAVGGYASAEDSKQFDIADNRTVQEVKGMLAQKEYQAVCKDWQRI
ncbi:MAG: 2-iminoacetate synthase ThiH [Halanaerobacter sp.]